MGDTPADDFRRIRSPLEGQRVRLRAVEEEDLDWINRAFWDPEVTEHLLVAWPEPVQGTRAWWQSTRLAGAAAFLIEAREGDRLGVCALEDISDRSRVATLGIWLAKSGWGRGFGTDAVRTVCRFGFREMNLQRIELGVFDTNPRGRRAYEKVGFKEEGRLRRAHFLGGRYVDLVLMGLLADELIEP
jgi:RimJ/RimL family protein N-acetyltransferase